MGSSLKLYEPHNYQEHAEEHLLVHPYAGLFLDMGLGKTVITLTAIVKLLNNFEVSKVLIIAPKRVAEHTWPEEIRKWKHTRDLNYSIMIGSERMRTSALKVEAQIYIINRENVEWLVTKLAGYWPFDMTVVDELSSFKSSKSKRFKALRMVRPKMHRVVGLTGTPAPNGLTDLWPQLFLLDQGERLEKTIGRYRDLYFTVGVQRDHVVFKYNLKKGADKVIHDKIKDICISMQSKDWLKLPKRIDNFIECHLTEKEQQAYDDFERDQVLMIKDEEVSALNAAALSNKLLQYANGAVYDDEKRWHEVHNQKLDMLEDLIDELQGEPCLVFYNYLHDVERIKKRIGGVELTNIKQIDQWNRGEIPIFILHPASAGHGLNMQQGGHYMFWFGMPWSLELYMQAVARLLRQGQEHPVIVNHLTCSKTIDLDVRKAIEYKQNSQQALLDAVKARILKYK